MILLDTNAIIWADENHKRIRPLLARQFRLYVSPISLLELQLLREGGRISLERDVSALAHDDRWTLDDPPAAAWFETATFLGWTRDPFDRLVAAHAQFRGWKLATGDRSLITHLGGRYALEL